MSQRFLSEEFWSARENELLLPAYAEIDSGEVDAALDRAGIVGAVLFRTSGTTGTPRLVCHLREGLLDSAHAVNAHLNVTEQDVWIHALPVFHVGGFAIYARAYLSGSTVYDLDCEWDPAGFVECCEKQRGTLASLVPTQVYDLVQGQHSCPQSLRAVLVGGGDLPRPLESQARELGWPILRTYGLSEAASQVATQSDGQAMLVLPHLEAEIGDEGTLSLRGRALCKGYLTQDAQGTWIYEGAVDENGWFQTDDLVALAGGELRFLGRKSSKVKVLGELIDLDALERAFLESANEALDVALVDVPDARSGSALILAIGADRDQAWIESLVQAFNATVAGFERISRVVPIGSIPRGELGKIRRRALREQVIEAGK